MRTHGSSHGHTDLASQGYFPSEGDQYPDVSSLRNDFENAELKTAYLSLSKQIGSLQVMEFKSIEGQCVMAKAVTKDGSMTSM